MLAIALAAASVFWAGLLVFTAAQPAQDASYLADAVYLFSSFICHQQPERSFHWQGTAWPVCARCLGLYAAAPLGALAALAVRTSRTWRTWRMGNFFLLCIASMPTAATWIAEHGLSYAVSNEMRFAAALPLGAAIAWLLVRTVR